MTAPLPPHIKTDPVLSWFWRRLHRLDQNILLIVCGQTGSCKSGSAIKIATMVDPKFNLDRIVFKADEFVKLASSNLPKGSVIIWDEIGVEHDSRDYYTTKNKLIKYVMQTFRYKNFMLIMTVPDLKSVDIGTRRLLHCYLEMHGPLSDRKMAAGMIRFVQVNPRSGKEYFKMPRFFVNRRRNGMVNYYVQRPERELENAYKNKKIAATEQWYKTFNEQLEYMQNVIGEKQGQRKKSLLSIKALANKMMDSIDQAFDFKRKRFSGPLVQCVLEDKDIVIAQPKASAIAAYLNQKLMKNGM